MVRFLHTSDWQLGMTRAWLAPDAQARFTLARVEVIKTIGKVARDKQAEFVVVAGDVYDANWIDPQTVARSLDAFRDVRLPVYLIPGNHDPFDSASIYRHPAFTRHKPANVAVLTEPGPHEVMPGVEILAAPWQSKRPTANPAGPLLQRAETAPGIRVLLAHGGMDTLNPDPDNPLLVRQQDLEDALAANRIHYAALGDRHSATKIGATGHIWYSGAPEPTAYVEDNQRKALLVDLSRDRCDVEQLEVGTWHFQREARQLASDADLEPLKTWLDGLPKKTTTTLKLGLRGTLSLQGNARLQEIIDHARSLLGGYEVWDDETQVAVAPTQSDLDALKFSGFAQSALEELKAKAASDGPDCGPAQDAIGLLWRLGSTGANP